MFDMLVKNTFVEMEAKHFGLIGYPLGHSFSAGYFSRKFADLGIDATYQNFPLKDEQELVSFFAHFPELNGINVTVPWKEKVLPFCQVLSPEAVAIGAVNCIKRRTDGKLEGHNTDWIGFKSSLERFLNGVRVGRALVLGTGGSSKAVRYALEQMEVEVNFVSVSGKGLQYSALSGRMHEYPLVVQTTPLGMFPLLDDCPAIPYEEIGSTHFCFDLIYNPALTKFLEKAKRQGAQIMNGEGMLIVQAEESWKIWNSG